MILPIPDAKDRATDLKFINQELDGLPLEIRKKCLFYLSRICGHQTLVPSSLKIPLCYDRTGAPQCRGGFADVWKGQYNGLDVAARVLRVDGTCDLNRIKKVGRLRLVMCQRAYHILTGILQGGHGMEEPSSS